MTRDELEQAGLYECDGCHQTYDSETSLMWCCNADEERRRGVYRGLE